MGNLQEKIDVNQREVATYQHEVGILTAERDHLAHQVSLAGCALCVMLLDMGSGHAAFLSCRLLKHCLLRGLQVHDLTQALHSERAERDRVEYERDKLKEQNSQVKSALQESYSKEHELKKKVCRVENIHQCADLSMAVYSLQTAECNAALSGNVSAGNVSGPVLLQ